jgi:formate dehydrogenase iron-sulfur subunit
LEELHVRARRRVEDLKRRGVEAAYLYGVEDEDPTRGSTGGIGDLHAFFLLTERPEVYNLPSAPTLPSRRVLAGLTRGLATMAGVALAAAVLFRSK